MKKSKKEDILKNFMEKRIADNKELFTKEEMKVIKQNINIMKKIYILGIKDVNDVKND